MRILIIELDNISAELSGEGQATLSLGRAWLDLGHEVTIIMPERWGDFSNFKQALKKAKIVKVRETPYERNAAIFLFTFIYRLFSGIKYINTQMNNQDFDLTFATGTFGLLLSLYKKIFYGFTNSRKSVFVVSWYTGFHWSPKQTDNMLNILFKVYTNINTLLFLKTTNIMNGLLYTESSYISNLLNKDFGFPKDNVIAIGPGIDWRHVKELEVNVPSYKQFDACYIGRIHPSKGIFDLIKAWSLVTKQIPEARLAIIGGGYPAYREELVKTIRELGLTNKVDLLGYVSEAKKYQTIKQSKFLVHPSYGDCVPNVFLEAASIGIPIITYYLPTYVDIRTLIIPVPIANINGLSEALVTNITKYDDNPKVYSDLIQKEMNLALEHDWQNIACTIIKKTSNCLRVVIRMLREADIDNLDNAYCQLTEREKFFFHPNMFESERGTQSRALFLFSRISLRLSTNRAFQLFSRSIMPILAWYPVVAVFNGEIAGFAFLKYKNRKLASLGIFVVPKYQNKGIGSELMHAVLDEAERRKLWTVELSVFEANLQARRLYEKADFFYIGKKSVHKWHGKEYVSLEMIKHYPLK